MTIRTRLFERVTPIGLICALLVVAGLLVAGCATEEEEASPPDTEIGAEDVPDVSKVQVERRSFDADISLGGQVKPPPGMYAEVGCAICPPVAEALVAVGDTVKAGDPLVRLSGGYPEQEANDLAAELEAAREDRQSAEDALDEAVQAAEEAVDWRQQRLASVQEMLNSDEGLTERERAVREAELAAAKLAVTRAEAALETVRTVREELLARHDARIAQLESEVEAAQSGGGTVTLRSPIDGQVTEVYTDQGEAPEGGPAPMVVVANLTNAYVEAAATDWQAREIAPGMRVVIDPSTRSIGPFEGETVWVSPPLDPDEVALELPEGGAHVVRIAFEDTSGEAQPGDPVNVIVQRGEVENALVIPSAAIEYESGIPWVYQDVDGELEHHAIVAGIANAEWTVVEQGLAEGDLIAMPSGVEATVETEMETEATE